jgi:hypothetical protein
MRSLKLSAIVAAAVAALALAPAGASARRHAHVRAVPLDRCRLTMFAEPHFLTTGETAEVFGQLLCTHGAATSGQTVTVYERVAGGPGFQVLGTTTTAAGGFYSMLAPSLTADTSFYATSATGRSGTRIVHVAPQVTLKGPAEGTQLLTGARSGVTFSGTVDPSDAGAVILLQRESATSNEDWHTIQRGIVGAGGAYSFTHRFTIPGDANLRVLVRPHQRFMVRGISNTLSYAISQRQNPRLTLNSSADPIAYGQPIQLTGTLAGGAGQPVTLLAHTFGGGFAPVAKATTDASGAYAFTQTPLQSTYYRVAGPSASSAVLFEGVRYVLTADVSASTVQSGQALTFAGTVTPARAGHVVYLERQNAFGGGFHVVDVTTVAADGTYSVAHAIFGTGKEVFRVKIPGDRADQSASSSPFTIEVTPAPGAALRPRPPAKLPGEGQI